MGAAAGLEDGARAELEGVFEELGVGDGEVVLDDFGRVGGEFGAEEGEDFLVFGGGELFDDEAPAAALFLPDEGEDEVFGVRGKNGPFGLGGRRGEGCGHWGPPSAETGAWDLAAWRWTARRRVRCWWGVRVL